RRPSSSWAAIRPRRIRCRCSTCSRARSSTGRTSSSSILVLPALPHMRPNMCGCAAERTFRPSTACSGTSSRTAGRTRNSSGNGGNFGSGANIFRGHCNVQGATDLGLDIVTLPLYYGLAEGAWKHWCRVWEVDYEWMLSRFDSKEMMETPGIPSTRWFDAAMLPKDQVSQKDNLKAMIVFGHGGNTVTRMPEAAKGIEKLDLLVFAS